MVPPTAGSVCWLCLLRDGHNKLRPTGSRLFINVLLIAAGWEELQGGKGKNRKIYESYIIYLFLCYQYFFQVKGFFTFQSKSFVHGDIQDIRQLTFKLSSS